MRNDVEFIPIVKKKECVDLAIGNVGADILKGFNDRSSKVNNAHFIATEWEKFCLTMAPSYLHALHGSGRIFSGVDRKILDGRLLKKIYNKRRLCVLHDYVACDAHLDVLRTFLEHKYKNE